MRKLVTLFLFVLISILGNSIYAQESEDTVKYQLQPVTITATRSPETTIEVPLAISVVGQSDLEVSRGYGLNEVLFAVPGVLAQSRYGNQDVRLTIRGFGARGAGARSNAGTSRGIRVLVDGFPETEPDGRTSFDLLDLSAAGRVEVVRSNASAVWGNASGGVLNIVSNTRFEQPYVEAQTMFGSYGFQKTSLRGGTILDGGRLFFSLTNTAYDGWREHSGSSQTMLSTGVTSSLGERTSLGVYLNATSNLFRIPGPLTRQQYDSLPQQSDSVFVARDERRNNRLGRIGFSLSHDLDGSNTISATAFVGPKYLQRSERNTFRDFNRYHLGGSLTYRNEFDWTQSARNILLIGMDEAYQDGAILFYSLTPSGGRGPTLRTNKREGANNFGVFAQNEILIGEEITIAVGARYENVTYYHEDFRTPTLNDQKSFERVTPKVGLTYRFTPTHSVYANIGGGIEVPAGNEVDPIRTFGTDTLRGLNPLLEPITSTTLEIGTKHIFPLGRYEGGNFISYDIALYRIMVTNDIVPYSGGAFYVSAGRTERLGAEIGVRLHVKSGLSIGGALTASRNRYDEYVIDSVHYGVPGAFADLKGNRMAGVPETYGSVDIRYEFPFLRQLYIKGNTQFLGSYVADDANQYEVPRHEVVNATVGIDKLPIADSELIISGFVGLNNAANSKYVASVWINPDLVKGQPVYLEPGLPRNFISSISLSWSF